MDQKQLLDALRLAEAALSTAPRFKIPCLPKEHDDSYKVAATISAILRAAKAAPDAR